MIEPHESQGHGPLHQLPTTPGASRCPGGGTRRPQAGRRPTRPATRRGAQGLLDVFQAPVLRHRQAAQAATARGPGPTLDRGTARPPQARTSRLPARVDQRRVLRLPPRLLPRVRPGPPAHTDDRAAGRAASRHRRGAAVGRGTPQPSRAVHPLSEDLRGPAPIGDPARWPGRAVLALTTLIAYLKGACHASFSTVRKFLRDVVGVTISRGELARIIAKVSRALERPYEELLGALPDEARLNVDETGHRQNGQRQWTWCFRASLYTLFKIDPSRSGDVLIEVLGTEFNGVVGCDYFSAYRRYRREFGVLLQFCLAHLIRDVKYLTTLPDARDRAYGERLREALRALFAVVHRRGGVFAAGVPGPPGGAGGGGGGAGGRGGAGAG